MKESTIYGLVFAAVLVTAALGIYFAFSYAPAFGKSVEGTRALADVREAYGFQLEGNIKDLEYMLKNMPSIELPYSMSGEGACLIFWSPYTGAVFGYPVKRGKSLVESKQLFENRGHILVDFQPAASKDRLCPDLSGITITDVLKQRGLL